MNCSIVESPGMRNGVHRALCMYSNIFYPNQTEPAGSNYLTTVSGGQINIPLKKATFSSDVAIQTEALPLNLNASLILSRVDGHDDQESTLSAADLASILKWSKDISSDINLSSGLFCFI